MADCRLAATLRERPSRSSRGLALRQFQARPTSRQGHLDVEIAKPWSKSMATVKNGSVTKRHEHHVCFREVARGAGTSWKGRLRTIRYATISLGGRLQPPIPMLAFAARTGLVLRNRRLRQSKEDRERPADRPHC